MNIKVNASADNGRDAFGISEERMDEMMSNIDKAYRLCLGKPYMPIGFLYNACCREAKNERELSAIIAVVTTCWHIDAFKNRTVIIKDSIQGNPSES